MKKELAWFALAVLLGIGWADYQVHDLRDGYGALDVYGWRDRQGIVAGVWMGEEYPILAHGRDGDVRVIAGGIDQNVTQLGRGAMQVAETQYGEMKLWWRSVSETLYDVWQNE